MSGSMKERPILFSAPMVRAILEGRKTQTRRIVKPQPPAEADALRDIPRENRWWAAYATRDDFGTEYRPLGSDQQHEWRCPYGVPGDLLWVRETWATNLHGDRAYYRADCEQRGKDYVLPIAPNSELIVTSWRPSIHMPRWASRITLRITNVRVERLQGITADDATAEGWPHAGTGGAGAPLRDAYPIGWYANLWNDINGPGAWDSNPWVWVVEFERASSTTSGSPT